MLACARCCAIHSVVFGCFSPDSLANRIQDCDSEILITADEGLRGGRKIPLKKNADAAMANSPSCKTCVVVRRTGGAVEMQAGRDRRSEEHTAELQSLMRISYAVFCLQKKTTTSQE